MVFKNHPKLKFWLKRYIEIGTNYRIRYHTPPQNEEKNVFTFDDGPVSSTLDILDILEKHREKAIFFVVAENVRKYPQIARQIIERGHLIGLHGLTHANMNKLPLSEFSRQIKEGQAVIKEICGVEARYFRPPFGQINPLQVIWLLAHGLIIFFWSCGVSASGEFDFMKNNRRLIVLLHDNAPLGVIDESIKKLNSSN